MHRRRLNCVAILTFLGLLGLGSCATQKIEKVPAAPRSQAATGIDIPRIMSGTVGSQVLILGYQPQVSPNYRPIIVRGYGLVVGLDGTGDRNVPATVRAYMVDFIESQTSGANGREEFWRRVSPDDLLNSMDTAVVIVEGIVPQGSLGRVNLGRVTTAGQFVTTAINEGDRFDVRVYPLPGGDTRSLEGGRLYTTELRPGPLTTGNREARPLAEARGPVFVNPFAEPGVVESSTVNRNVGTILNGGEVLEDMPIKLQLTSPSHRLAGLLQSAINSRFPREPGQDADTARGESDAVIEITVPPSFRGRTDEFIELLRHTTVRQANPESVAMSIRRMVTADPSLANTASWRWQALGVRCLPIIKDLYDYSEPLPRLAALRAGARLDDPLTVPHLLELAADPDADLIHRQASIAMLGDMRVNPLIDRGLRELLESGQTEIRLDAYEALVKRGDILIDRYYVDEKFVLDVIPTGEPLIYITQYGEPRIALFGEGLEINRPVTVQAWSNRLMVKGDAGDEQVEVYYRQPGAINGHIARVSPSLGEFVQYLGQDNSIELAREGLGLTYSEVVGAIHQIWSQDYIAADFKAQQDRILAAILSQQQESAPRVRPEFAGENEDWLSGSDDAGADAGAISNLDRTSPERVEPTVPRRSGSGSGN